MNPIEPGRARSSATPSPFKQTLYLIGLFVGCLLLFGLIGLVLNRLLPFDDAVSNLYIIQNLSAAGSFLLPAWLFARRVAPGHAASYLGCRPCASVAYLLGMAAILSLIPWINALTAWNADMPRAWQDNGIGLFFKRMSEQNEQLLQLFLHKTDAGSLCLNLLTLALMPAICEEFFFRGCLQTHLTRHSRQPQVAIWLTAFIFSLLHLDPVGFLPRLFLGALLGYVFAASRSLYPGILLHFLNNAAIVVAYYLYGNGCLTQHPESFSGHWHGWSAILGLSLAAGFIVLLYRQNRSQSPA